MAEIGVTRATGSRSAHRDPLVERTGFRLSWGAIVAGFMVATALQMVLSTLGAAVGFAAFDPGEGDSARSLGIGAGLWAAVTALVSLYPGGRAHTIPPQRSSARRSSARRSSAASAKR